MFIGRKRCDCFDHLPYQLFLLRIITIISGGEYFFKLTNDNISIQ